MDRTARELELQARRARLSTAARDALSARLRGGAHRAGPACLVPLSSGVGPALFCVHPAGGDVLAYAALADHLRRPVYGLQSPGLAGEQAPLDSIEALAAHYVDALSEVAPDGPVLLAGWSLGAHVVLEMGHELLRRGRAPALSALIDADPVVPAPESLPAVVDPIPWLTAIAEYVERVGGRPLGVSVDEMARDAAPLDRFLEALREAGLPNAPTPTADRLSRLLTVFEANTRALARYRPRPVAAKLTVLQCAGSVFQAGWSALSDREVAVREIPGDHYTLIVEPHVAVLARKLETAAVGGLLAVTP